MMDLPPEGHEPPPTAYGDWGDPFANMPLGAAQTRSVCGRPGNDLVRDVFCAAEPPQINSLLDFQVAFKLGPTALQGPTGVALAGHSTSLSARSVSAINPRVIEFRLATPASPPVEFIALSFNRGDQFAELAVLDRIDAEFRFYVVRYEQPCNASPAGCRPGDLLTEAAEKDWLNVTLYDEPSVTNTVFDCATCHQPDGPNSPKMLRMQEFDDPWTHWFYAGSEGGQALIDDYAAAKGDENIANLTRDQITYTSPGGLQLAVGARNHYQPNIMDWGLVEREVQSSAAMSGGNQPHDNNVPGTSATWRAGYERSKRGEAIPVPYHDVKVTDPVKLERMTMAYRAYLRGELTREELPDLRDIFPDDPQRLAAMGLATEPGLSGEAVLIQACSMCHNEKLDQSLTRARFRADLVGMSRAEKDVAIMRLSLPANDVHAMPPARLRMLTPEARRSAIEVLRR